jgi:hypothetical protein
MSEHTRAQAEARLREVAQVYNEAFAALRTAKASAADAVKDAKGIGLSQHDIARIMGPIWAAEHNPQYPPVLDLQRPPRIPPQE